METYVEKTVVTLEMITALGDQTGFSYFSKYVSAYLPKVGGQAISIMLWSMFGLQTKSSQKDRPVIPIINKIIRTVENFRSVLSNSMFLNHTDWFLCTALCEQPPYEKYGG